MNKETWLSILRSVLTAGGAYLVGKSFLGNTIDDNLLLGITGSVFTAISIIWGIVDKTANLEKFDSAIRSIFLFFGPLVVGAGYIKQEVVDSSLMILTVLGPIIMSEINKRKNIKVAEGKLGIADLSGVDKKETVIQPKTYTPIKPK